MAAKGKAPQVKLRRTIAQLEAELEQRTTERDEALAQQAASAEVLGVISSSPSDLKPVFDAILEKAHALCGADHGSLMLRDGDKFRAVATYGYSEAWAERLREGLPIADNPVFEALLNGADFVHIPDVVEIFPNAAFIALPIARETVDATGARTALFVPLRKDGELLGHISAGRREVRPFTDKQIALLQNFAAQAVIAMENARLINETREALEQQTATAEVLQVINSSPGDLAPVFDAMLEKAMRLSGAVHGTLTLYDGELYRCVAGHNLPEALFEILRKPRRATPDSPQERLLQGERIVHIADMAAMPISPDNEVARAGVEIGFTRTILFVPLRKDNVLLGWIAAQRHEVRPFIDKQIALLQNFAAQAVIAMENARLLTETREALERQTATAEVLGVINSSPGDLAPVFEAMLEKALRLCDGSSGMLQSYDGTHFHALAVRGPSAFEEWGRQLGPLDPAPGTTLADLAQGERVVQVADAKESEGYRIGARYRRAIVDIGGFGSILSVALHRDDVLVGALHLYRTEARRFTDKQIALLQNFAAQAVIAIENARLLGELRQRTDEVAELNRGLESRVAEQVEELGRVGRLKRFLAPQLAELIVSQGDEKILESHRCEIVVVFCDLRGYTAFTETAEPEEVLKFLREYHGALGPLVSQYEGTLDQFSGDGIMVFFNDPVPCPDPAERAVKMAMAMREAAGQLIAAWRLHGCELGFGAGIAQGYATLGQIGFSERAISLEIECGESGRPFMPSQRASCLWASGNCGRTSWRYRSRKGTTIGGTDICDGLRDFLS